MEEWLRERLTTCLGFDVPNDMIKYVLSMKHPGDVDEYLKSLLDVNCSEHRIFMADCKQRLFNKTQNKKTPSPQPLLKAKQPKNNKYPNKEKQQKSNNNEKTQQEPRRNEKKQKSQNTTNQRKPSYDDKQTKSMIEHEPSSNTQKQKKVENNELREEPPKKVKQQKSLKNNDKEILFMNNNKIQNITDKEVIEQNMDPQKITEFNNNKRMNKLRVKYMKIFSNDGHLMNENIKLSGRRLCNCQASRHKLISNCIGCGRIVCEQEGSGPCLFCGLIVATKQEQKILRGKSKESGDLLKSLTKKGGGEALKKAMEQRDRLLEYDRNSEKRTTVIDDESDYFQENSVWLSSEEREKYEKLKEEWHEKKHAGRAKRQVKIDFAGRHIDDDDWTNINESYEREMIKAVEKTTISNKSARKESYTSESSNDENTWQPIFLEDNSEKISNLSMADGLERYYNRVQDKELLEMQDMRHCLSLHQPWASLLVAGIKKHEGRVWYSEHRGRLWIASSAKEPSIDDINDLKDFYKTYYNNPNIEFPQSYPSGCLLGCVIIDDCLAQEEYRDDYPNGESTSPYVFICSKPQPLPVVFPIKGQHKIYQIDPKIHSAACKTLMRSKTSN